MTLVKPSNKPLNPNFSSGPCAKRPGWELSVLKNTPIGRSHRSKECKDKLNQAIVKSKQVLKLPDSYALAIMTGSNTGALEAAMWSMLGYKGVDVLAWENFGKDWVIDVLEQLKTENVNSYVADYGKLPDLKKVNFKNDVIFTWNGTTAGVRIPNGDWIPDDREGLTICDATSGIFAKRRKYDTTNIMYLYTDACTRFNGAIRFGSGHRARRWETDKIIRSLRFNRRRRRCAGWYGLLQRYYLFTSVCR